MQNDSAKFKMSSKPIYCNKFYFVWRPLLWDMHFGLNFTNVIFKLYLSLFKIYLDWRRFLSAYKIRTLAACKWQDSGVLNLIHQHFPITHPIFYQVLLSQLFLFPFFLLYSFFPELPEQQQLLFLLFRHPLLFRSDC